MKKALGIDLGAARVGLALADDLGMLAHPLETVKVKAAGDLAAYIAEVIRREKVEVAVIGLPRNMDGSHGPAAAKAKEFGEKLRAKAPACEMRYWDERMTSVAAQKALHEMGLNVKNSRRRHRPGCGADDIAGLPRLAGDARVMRLRMLIAYDGSGFRGWQSQAGGGTVQDHLEAAFARLCGERVPVHGAGRTDAGVHALGQCAHADVARELDWTAALNAHLPREIRVLRCRRTRENFHARYSAKGKVYTYRIWTGAVLSPFELRRAWHLPGGLDLDAMRTAARAFEGRHDFKAFAANRGKPEHDTVRTISSVTIGSKGPVTTLRFHGDGFLYKMVRLMTGLWSKPARAARRSRASQGAWMDAPGSAHSPRRRKGFISPGCSTEWPESAPARPRVGRRARGWGRAAAPRTERA